MEIRVIYLRQELSVHAIMFGDDSISHYPSNTYGTLSGSPDSVLRAAYGLNIALDPIFAFYSDNGINNSDNWMAEIQADLIKNPDWKAGVWYSRGHNVQYNGLAYTVIQSHPSQAGWEPPNVPALFFPVPVLYPGENYPRWRQPFGSEDAYKIDERVTHNGKDWESDINANVFEPGVSQWTELVLTPDPQTYPAWVQPTGSQDAYPLNAEVSFNGQNWRSTAANNVWQPGVFGWVVF